MSKAQYKKGFQLHFVPARFDTGTTTNKKLLPVRNQHGEPLFFETLEAVTVEIEAMSRLVLDTRFYAVPSKRRIDELPAALQPTTAPA